MGRLAKFICSVPCADPALDEGEACRKADGLIGTEDELPRPPLHGACFCYWVEAKIEAKWVVRPDWIDTLSKKP